MSSLADDCEIARQPAAARLRTNCHITVSGSGIGGSRTGPERRADRNWDKMSRHGQNVPALEPLPQQGPAVEPEELGGRALVAAGRASGPAAMWRCSRLSRSSGSGPPSGACCRPAASARAPASISPLGQRDGALDQVLQLAHVARDSRRPRSSASASRRNGGTGMLLAAAELLGEVRAPGAGCPRRRSRSGGSSISTPFSR